MSTAADEEQSRYLADALKSVKEHAFYMKRAMDKENLLETLEHATEMLRELRTNAIGPKFYYELYMKIIDEMRELEDYFITLQKNGHSMAELYERVQGCGNILPRLYLMCCVGGVYTTSHETPVKEIMHDLIEMIKGVQHPMRGLFLRYYLSQVTRNRLPDIGSDFEGSGGNLSDSIDFIIRNFTESNRLWVRMQNQGASKDRRKREKERQDLRLLVGTNLVRLSQIEGLDANEYKTNVLPRVLEQILACKDTIAQSYLMDCIIQVFPDDFHLHTLEPFLQTCTSLKEKVNVRAVLESLMERLTNYYTAQNNGRLATDEKKDADNEGTSFQTLNDCITTLIEGRAGMTLAETLRLQTSLATYAQKCYPSRVDFLTHCLSNCLVLVEKSGVAVTTEDSQGKSRSETTPSADDVAAQAQLEALLLAPLASLGLRVLDITPFKSLLSYLSWNSWREVAVNMLRVAVSRHGTVKLTDMSKLEALFGAITPLLRDQTTTTTTARYASGGYNGNGEEEETEVESTTVDEQFKTEQLLVSRLVHLISAENTDDIFTLYVAAKNYFLKGGSKRLQFTLVPFIFVCLSLARKVYAREQSLTITSLDNIDNTSTTANDTTIEPLRHPELASTLPSPKYSVKKVFQLILESITLLATANPIQALKMFLHAAQIADACNLAAIAYEFAKEALLIYECEVTDSKIQVRVLTTIIGSFLNCQQFPVEDYEALITKVAQYSNKLLRKPDQSKMITICSHLFWPGGVEKDSTGSLIPARYADKERVVECMQRALKIASASSPYQFVDILDRYIYYYEREHPLITERHLSGIISLINEQLTNKEDNLTNTMSSSNNTTTGMATGSNLMMNPILLTHFKNTLGYLKLRQQLPETSSRFSGIQLST